MRLRVSADEAALGAYQAAARLLDRLAGPEQVKPHHAAVKTALRPGPAPHAELGHVLVGELGKRGHRTRRRVHRQFAWGILAAGPSCGCAHALFTYSPRRNARLSGGVRNCYSAQIRHDQGCCMARLRFALILTGAMVVASARGEAGAQGGSTYVRQT